MKKIFYLTLLSFLLISCSKDEDNNEPNQGYTSFVVYHNETVTAKNSIAGYYTADGKCKLLGTLGDLTKGKYSTEIRVNIDTLKNVYVFTDYNNVIKFDTVFILKKNIKNIFEITKYTKGIHVDKNNELQYPH